MLAEFVPLTMRFAPVAALITHGISSTQSAMRELLERSRVLVIGGRWQQLGFGELSQVFAEA
jgi:hypothetical protein